MIRRGLQFVCSVVLLGAAPLLAQQQGFPTQITLQDFTNNAINGLYLQVGESQNSTTPGAVFQRFTTGTNTPAYWVNAIVRTNDWTVVRVYSSYPTDINNWLYASEYGRLANNAFKSSYTVWTAGSTAISGAAILSWEVPPNEYEQAFPDWDSAAVKIPLGFAFGLALWASVLAFHVPMQWVRSLSERAT